MREFFGHRFGQPNMGMEQHYLIEDLDIVAYGADLAILKLGESHSLPTTKYLSSIHVPLDIYIRRLQVDYAAEAQAFSIFIDCDFLQWHMWEDCLKWPVRHEFHLTVRKRMHEIPEWKFMRTVWVNSVFHHFSDDPAYRHSENTAGDLPTSVKGVFMAFEPVGLIDLVNSNV